ncbi:hypothetical protein Hanom_Chr16g01432541 [Helianthus anomalus]
MKSLFSLRTQSNIVIGLNKIYQRKRVNLRDVRAFTFYPSKYVRGSFYIIKGIKSGCEWRREKMLLFICMFERTLFTYYNFLIYIESGCE